MITKMIDAHPFPKESRCDRTSGIVSVRTAHSVDANLERIKRILAVKGATLFAVIDHARAAHETGLEMPPTTVLIFGSPRSGTLLMLASPAVALDLPHKVLIAEDEDGAVWKRSWKPFRRHTVSLTRQLSERPVFVSVARAVVLLLRVPLLIFIGAGAVLICAAARADDWLKAWRPSVTRPELTLVGQADHRKRARIDLGPGIARGYFMRKDT